MKPEDEKEDKDEEAKAEGTGAEGEEGAEGEQPEGFDGNEKKGKKKLIIIIAGVVVLLIGIAAGLYFTGMLDSVLGKKPECTAKLDENDEPVVDEHGEPVMDCPEEEHAEEGEHAKKGGGGGGHGEEGGAGNFVEIPPMIVNLNTENGAPRYLRLTVQLEMESSEDVAAVQAVIPRVVDQFQTYLRELRVRDLRGSAGIYRLQMELLWRVNQAAAPIEVKDVLFQEILIQ